MKTKDSLKLIKQEEPKDPERHEEINADENN